MVEEEKEEEKKEEIWIKNDVNGEGERRERKIEERGKRG